MTEVLYEVRIVEKKTKKVVKKMGPMPLWTAERVENGASINLNHKDYKVVTVPVMVGEGE